VRKTSCSFQNPYPYVAFCFSPVLYSIGDANVCFSVRPRTLKILQEGEPNYLFKNVIIHHYTSPVDFMLRSSNLFANYANHAKFEYLGILLPAIFKISLVGPEQSGTLWVVAFRRKRCCENFRERAY
jgi:hypothetical protein